MPDGRSDGRTCPRVPLRDRVRGLWAGGPFREVLVGRADVRPGHRVLDLGCGQGTLAFLVKERRPEAVVTGLDMDERALGHARREATRRRLDVAFDAYDGGRMPYAGGAFDRVVSSRAPPGGQGRDAAGGEEGAGGGGRAMLADHGPPRGRYARAAAALSGIYEDIGENVTGLVPARIREAGFEDAGGERPTNAGASGRKVVRRERRSLRV